MDYIRSEFVNAHLMASLDELRNLISVGCHKTVVHKLKYFFIPILSLLENYTEDNLEIIPDIRMILMRDEIKNLLNASN